MRSFRGRLEFTHFKVYLNTFTFILIGFKILKFNKYYMNFKILVVEKVVRNIMSISILKYSTPFLFLILFDKFLPISIVYEEFLLLYFLLLKALMYLFKYLFLSFELYCIINLGCSKAIILSNNLYWLLIFVKNLKFSPLPMQ